MERFSLSSLYETRDTHEKMRTDLNHLPEEKQRELGQIARVIGEMDGVEMVILYGSYARGDWKEAKDLPPNPRSGHPSDYDILVITREQPETGFERVVREAINTPQLSTRANPIAHDIEDVNQQLGEGRYFFLDIKREGRMLYNTERFKLAEPHELTAQEKQVIAKADFENWYGQAKRFYRYHEVGYEEQDLKGAIFHLNQATESAYKAILLVFTSYCPHEHMLEWIGRDAAIFGPVLYDIFPNDTKEHEEYFKLMNRAYIGARYQKDFIVHWHDLDYLAPRVKQLLEVTEAICLAHLESIVENE
jgi:uncharacterized protein